MMTRENWDCPRQQFRPVIIPTYCRIKVLFIVWTTKPIIKL